MLLRRADIFEGTTHSAAADGPAAGDRGGDLVLSDALEPEPVPTSSLRVACAYLTSRRSLAAHRSSPPIARRECTPSFEKTFSA